MDRDRIIKAAQKYTIKHQYDRAIAEYQKILNAHPSDANILMKIAELQVRCNDREQAVSSYLRAAEIYEMQGFSPKAAAVNRQILEIDPSQADAMFHLAKYYDQGKFPAQAFALYSKFVEVDIDSGDLNRSILALDRMVALQPDNVDVRIAYAQTLSRAGRAQEAIQRLQTSAQLLKEEGKTDEYIKLAMTLLESSPHDTALAHELARLHLKKRDALHALSALHHCFLTDPNNLETLDLSAQAFIQLGQKNKAISVLHRVAADHSGAGRRDEYVRVMKRILQLDPKDKKALAGVEYDNGAQNGSVVAIQPTLQVNGAELEGKKSEQPEGAGFQDVPLTDDATVGQVMNDPPQSSFPTELGALEFDFGALDRSAVLAEKALEAVEAEAVEALEAGQGMDDTGDELLILEDTEHDNEDGFPSQESPSVKAEQADPKDEPSNQSR